MPKRVLDVGQCDPDHGPIRRLLTEKYGAEVVRAHVAVDAFEALRAGRFDLVLVNRKLDQDYSDGLEIIRQIKADSRLADTPCMLVTNYAEHQEAAVAAGAALGFGKAELSDAATQERLAAVLGPPQK